MSKSNYKGILFDLDGTLVDTAPDMAAALNRILTDNGRAEIAYDIIRPWVSHGGAALVHLGFADVEGTQKEALRQAFLSNYQNNIANKSCLFPGIKTILNWVKAQNLQWGIVTNKPEWLSKPLLAELEFPLPYSTLICGDTLSENKPHPLPMLSACKEMGLKPSDCIYLGDAKRDIEAAQNAKMESIVANYGYIEKDDDVASWNADYRIDHALDALDIFKK